MPNWIKNLFDEGEMIDLGVAKTGTEIVVDGTEWVITEIQFGRRITPPFNRLMQIHFTQREDYYR